METEYLGYILSRDGIKPKPKKIKAIFALTGPLGLVLKPLIGITTAGAFDFI